MNISTIMDIETVDNLYDDDKAVVCVRLNRLEDRNPREIRILVLIKAS
jgi:hypothetical protein